ncbi:MAG: hypothetical protein ACAH80_12175 [Alphaproteobacteria bacterium]
MKTFIAALALTALMIPTIASADMITTTRTTRDGDMTIQTQSASESPFAGSYSRVRETTIVKTYKPAPSDTDYSSNFVNPGSVETSTEVREYTTVR